MSEAPTHFWVFDSNHRVYKKSNTSGVPRYSEGPIYREHWVKTPVIGETSRSWLVGYHPRTARKIPKKPPLPRGVLATEADVELDTWLHDHRHRIIAKLGYATNADGNALLIEVARRLGYQPLPPGVQP